MKILFIAPYIYAPDFHEHNKNKSGFGIMVNDIASAVGQSGHEVVFATHAFGPERKADHFTIVKNTLWRNLRHGRYKGILKFVFAMSKTHISAKAGTRAVLYYLNLGYIEHLIQTQKPDVVHIHGCSNVILEMMGICQKHHTRFVVTLHGLLEDAPDAGDDLKQCEHQLILYCEEHNIPLTVVSTRMRERLMLPYYAVKKLTNVAVITNGIDVAAQEATFDLKKKLGIAEHQKVILAVGSVCERKNQKQMVRAFAKLSAPIRGNTVLVLVGTLHDSYDISAEIKSSGVADQVFCTDFVPREELKNYYSVASMTLNTSISEGFGLPIIEGMVYGVPAVVFADLDVILDVYREDVMLLCNERSDDALASTIERALNKEWNKAVIRAHAASFSLEEMAKKYNEVYEVVMGK